MQGPIVDLVLLLLLILFFGLQQRRRPQVYFRFWFAGWVFVFLSYVVWAMQGRLTKLLRVAECGVLRLSAAGRVDVPDVAGVERAWGAKGHPVRVGDGRGVDGDRGYAAVHRHPAEVLAIGVLLAEGLDFL